MTNLHHTVENGQYAQEMKTDQPPFPVLDDDLDAEEQRTAEILTELKQLHAPTCFRCSRPVCFHEYVLSVVTGFKTTPHCTACLASGLGRSPADFVRDAYNYIRRQTCYRSGWQWASQQENQPLEQPSCIWPAAASRPQTPMTAPAADRPADPDAAWDAGDMACGELVLKLRLRLRSLQPGQVLHLIAQDPGARADIPAWCTLTGHRLLSAEHPQYRIQRKNG